MQNMMPVGPTVAEVWRFFKMAAVRHLGFVLCVFGPLAKGIWWT